MNGGKQDLSLNARCLNEVGTPIHELMHVIGYMHEQSRKDRDSYITINWNNIRPAMKSQFAKCESCDLQGLAYDTGSVMQYMEYSFSINEAAGLKTMVAKDGSKLGQDNGFSKLDLQGINMIYCGGAAPSTSAPGATTAAPATTEKPATAAPTAAPTTTKPQTGACLGNNFDFWGGWGGCWTYDQKWNQWSNYPWCKTHYDVWQQLYASDVCPECGCTKN